MVSTFSSAVAEAMAAHLSSSDLDILCQQLQSADELLAHLNCQSLPPVPAVAARMLVEQCEAVGALPVLIGQLRRTYPITFGSQVTAMGVNGYQPSAYSNGVNPAIAFNPAILQAKRRRSPLRWLILLIVIAVLIAIPAFLIFNLFNHDRIDGSPEAVAMVSPNEGWVVGMTYVKDEPNNILLVHYQNGNVTTLTTMGQGHLYSIYMLNANEGWAVGDQPTGGDQNTSALILHYQNGTWSKVATDSRATLYSVYMVSPTEGWATGDRADTDGILHYSGGKWQIYKPTQPTQSNQPGDFPSVLNSVFMTSKDSGWAVGRNSILKYDGSNWLPQSNPADNELKSVYMVSASDGWAVGPAGTVLRYQNGVWDKQTAITQQDLTGISFSSPNDGWAVSDEALLHYSNGTWTKQISDNPPCSRYLRGVQMLSATEGWAVGGYGGMLHYQGGNWGWFNGDCAENQGNNDSVDIINY